MKEFIKKLFCRHAYKKKEVIDLDITKERIIPSVLGSGGTHVYYHKCAKYECIKCNKHKTKKFTNIETWI